MSLMSPVIRFAHNPLPMPDWETILGTAKSKRSGRSWWAVRYTDGRIIHEWDKDPGSPNKHADWPRLPKRGRQSVRLYCPGGQMAQLGDTRDATGRIFQLKVAHMSVGIGGTDVLGRETLAHLIGIVHGFNGECTCYAWEPIPHPRRPEQPDDAWYAKYQAWKKAGKGRLIGPWDDNVNAFRYHNIGRINADVLGIDDGEGR